jgi:hypothetical protein
MPTGGEWTPLKHDATNFVKDEGRSSVSPERLLHNYLKANGGARTIARSGSSGDGSGMGSGGARGGGGSGGGGGRGGGAARSVGRNLGGFLASVGRVGLDEALREVSLTHLIGRPADEVTVGLLDALAAPGSTLDEHAARLALARLHDELFQGTQTYEDVERVLSQALDQQGLTRILARFFGHYLYERFCRDFYETWVKKVGSVQAARSLRSIKDCIESSVKAKLTGRDVTRVNWRGKEGLRLTEQVMQETLEIFEVTA